MPKRRKVQKRASVKKSVLPEYNSPTFLLLLAFVLLVLLLLVAKLF